MPGTIFFLFFLFMVAYPHYQHLFSGPERFRNGDRLSKPLIGEGGRIYACCDKMLLAFENNGSIAWFLPLSFKCNMYKAPVDGGRGKIYLIAENRVLQINIKNVGTSEPATQILLDPGTGQKGDEIVGVAVSTMFSSVFINVKNRGLFAYSSQGQLLWSAGPLLDQFGYRQGCRKHILDCFFASAPVIDQCEASVYVSNTEGEIYSVSIRSPQFKWIQDLSSIDKVYSVTAGNNGRLYVTVPSKSLILALDVSSGNILWQNSIGPLSSAESSPVVDSNGWVTIGSLDGFLYSFSPTGILKKFPKKASSDSVIQFSSFLHCSGYALYFSRTEMEGKVIHMNDQNICVSATKPRSSVFALIIPATGKIHWSESHHGPFLSSLSKSDLQNFVLDEGMLLAFVAASNIGDRVPCRSQGLKLASSCSQGTHKRLSIYTGNRRTILLFLLFESLLLVVLAAVMRFCCVFWRKKKLRDQDLGLFLEKRRSLQLKKKEYDMRITELEQKAGEEAVDNEAIEKIGEMVRERQGIERKLSTTYSLGRDRGGGSKPESVLPLYGGRTRSYSFQRAKKESVTVFHTSSNTSSEDSSTEREPDSDSEEKEEMAKTPIEAESSSNEEQLGFGRRKYQRSPSEPAKSMPSSSTRIWLKRRRTLSSSN